MLSGVDLNTLRVDLRMYVDTPESTSIGYLITKLSSSVCVNFLSKTLKCSFASKKQTFEIRISVYYLIGNMFVCSHPLLTVEHEPLP